MFNNLKNHAWVIPHIEKAINKMRKSNLSLIRSHHSYYDVKRVRDIFLDAANKNQTLIFSFTPNLAENCVQQLQAYQNIFNTSDFVIYNINRYSHIHQAGPYGLLAKHGLTALFMLSDSEGGFAKNFKFPYVRQEHFIHPSILFLPRTTIVVKPDASVHVFMLPMMLSEEVLSHHLQEMQHFIQTPVAHHHHIFHLKH